MITKKVLMKYLAVYAGIALVLVLENSALAVGTLSGTVVGNRATVNYVVNTVGQAPIESTSTGNSTAGVGLGTDTEFVVDNLVDLVVSTVDVSPVQVNPGLNNHVLTFSVLNEGNTVQDYSLNATQLAGGAAAFGGTDAIDMLNVRVFVESGATAGFQSAQDQAVFIDELAADSSVTVYIVADPPAVFTAADIASFHLEATTRDGGTDTAAPETNIVDVGALTTNDIGSSDTNTDPVDTVNDVDVVFADDAGSNDALEDGIHSSQNDYQIQSSQLTVTKTSTVESDPINGTTNPKRIPGAVIRYTVTVANAAGAGIQSADSVTITDDLDGEISAGTLAFNTGTFGAGFGIRTVHSVSGTVDYSNATDADNGDFNAGAPGNPNDVEVRGITLAAGESVDMIFDVTVQ